MESEERTATPLTAAYRIIRGVAPPDVPVAGTLAACGERTVVLADAAGLEGWPGWRHGGAEHVLGPEDLARTSVGHLAVLPLCSRRLDAWLAARLTCGPSLAGGEAVTLVISLLRGVQEAWTGRVDETDELRGTWWLTDDGRPMLVLGDGARAAEQAVATIERVVAVCDDRVLRRALEAAAVALARPRGLRRASGEVEQQLFEACAPRSLAAPGDELVGEAESVRDALRPRRGAEGADARRGRFAAIADLLEAHVDAGLGEAVAGALRAWLPHAARAPARSHGRGRGDRRQSDTGRDRRRVGRAGVEARGGRRAPLLVGAAAAALVLLGGVLWPEENDRGDAAGAPARAHGMPGSPSASPAGAAPKGAGTGSDSERAASGGDEPSPAEKGESEEGGREEGNAGDSDGAGESGESAESAALRLVEAGEGATAVLIEDFGDVVVTRIDEDGASRHVLLARAGDGWRLRQVYEASTG